MVILHDVLGPRLVLVICGTAAGNTSAKEKAYYADPTNRFWTVLACTGLVPKRLDPKDYRELAQFGIGLTDLAKEASGRDKGLRPGDFDIDGFRNKILEYQPDIVGFNGKKAAKIYLNRNGVNYGFQDDLIGETKLFVLPSTSRANVYWNEGPWMELAEHVIALRGQS